MNIVVAMAAVFAAADLPQRVSDLRDYASAQRRVIVAAVIAAGVGIAAVASPLLDALDISAPNLQIGAGMVLVLWSVAAFLRWNDEPAPAAVAAGLVPGLFPVVLTPSLGVVLLAVGARNGLVVGSMAAVVVAAPLALPADLTRRVATRAARLGSASAGVVLGIAMMVDGVLAV